MQKRRFLFLGILPLTMGCAAGLNIHDYLSYNQEEYPLSDQVTEIELNKIPMRVEILDEDTIRFEYKYYSPIYKKLGFLDRDTFLVPFRHKYHGISEIPTVIEQDNKCTISFKQTMIEIDTSDTSCRNFAHITIKRNNEVVYKTDEGLTNSDINSGDLPTPGIDTSKAHRLIDYPRVLIPNDGYSTLSAQKHPELATTGGYEIQDQKDLYVMIHEGDARKLRNLYNKLAGPSEMVRLAALGAWDSRYYPYNEHTVQLEVDNYHKYGLPLDNFVIDTDWRKAVSGAGYDVNTDLFPDMRGTISKLHAQNIEVMFNDHPEPVVSGMNVLGGQEIYNRNYNLQKILDLGLDTWWYDRNWSTALISPTIKDGVELIRHETWGDYIFNDVTKQYYQSVAGNKDKYRRPTAMSNLVDVQNGSWDGTKDSASHRYSFQWTGDTNPDNLPTEINNVIKAGNNGIPYMSSDLAGHNVYVASNYYYARWIQYGAFSPIFRIHCTRDLPIHCQPWYRLEDNDAWEKDDNAVTRFKKYIDMRYRLMPLFYQLANENYETGLPIARALAFNYPDDENVKGMEDEWMLGNNILFAPLSEQESRRNIITDGEWTAHYHLLNEDNTGHYPINDDYNTEYKDPTSQEFETIGSNIPSGTKLNLNLEDLIRTDLGRNVGFVAKFEGDFIPTHDATNLKFTGSVDDGVYVVIDGQTPYTSEWCDGSTRHFNTGINLTKGTKYHTTIYYYQNTSGGNLSLFEEGDHKSVNIANEVKSVYLPKGKWYDPFHNYYYDCSEGGSWTENLTDDTLRTYDADQSPIFIRLGGMIPLVDNAPTTKDINWRNLYYDVYPSADESKSDSSYFYEDDYDSIGYQVGEYRKSNYGYHYEVDNNGYRKVIIDLGGANGSFDNDFEVTDRSYTLRIHNADNKFLNANIVSATVNGKEVEHPIDEGNVTSMPFNTHGKMNDTDEVTLITVPFDSVRKSHQIVITYSPITEER